MKTLRLIFRMILAIPIGAALAMCTVYIIPYVAVPELAHNVKPATNGWPGQQRPIFGMEIDSADIGEEEPGDGRYRCEKEKGNRDKLQKCSPTYRSVPVI